MSPDTVSWENTLLMQAYDALENRVEMEPINAEQQYLKMAYSYCTDITKLHSRTFYIASGLLPEPEREATRALYAFCRISDDIIDTEVSDRRAKYEQWRQRSLAPHPPIHDLAALAWADARATYQIPHKYAEQLLDGLTDDLDKVRYATFAELAQYCYGAASTVGLMSMHIVGYSSEEALPYAVKLGVALQLTNILRDVAEDWRNGRLYLPQEELAAFNLNESDIAQGKVTNRWREFMRFQIARTRQLYAESLPGVAMLGKDGRFAIAAAGELYRAILDDIERHDYDVFSRRAYVTTPRKLQALPGIWWRAKTSRYPNPPAEGQFVVPSYVSQ